MEEVIDFADITNQINRREMSRVFEFNLMLVGTTGIGKSTLVKSLFQNMINPDESVGDAKLNEYAELLEENGVRLKLRCIETSNFDHHESDVYLDYIESNFRKYFVAQRRQSSWTIEDSRVHCCLYMIPNYGKLKLRDEDIQTMLAIHQRVNLVPIIAKADSFNNSQLAKFKENILADLKLNGINYYKFSHDDKEDEERCKAVRLEAERFPFAVVAADGPVLIDKKHRWIRETISGKIDIINKNYDFDALAKLVIRHCMLNLIDSTHIKHYAKFKTELLEQAKLHQGKNLAALGLEPHEIGRIEHDAKSHVNRKSLKQQRLELEKELETMRTKLSALRSKLTSRDKPVVKEKPSILRELRNH